MAMTVEVREAMPDRTYAERYWVVQDGISMAYFGRVRNSRDHPWQVIHVDGRRVDALRTGLQARNTAMRMIFCDILYVESAASESTSA